MRCAFRASLKTRRVSSNGSTLCPKEPSYAAGAGRQLLQYVASGKIEKRHPTGVGPNAQLFSFGTCAKNYRAVGR